MKRSVGLIVLGLVLYLVFLLATAPAIWVAEAAARASNGTVTLTDPSGTFWRGSAQLNAGNPTTGVRRLGTLHWQVNPLWLFVARAQLSLQLEGDAARGQASLRAGRSQINVQDLSVTLPAQLAALFYPPAAFFAPTGTIQVSAPNVELSHDGLVAVADARWEGAGGRFTGPNALGSYRVELTGRGETATFRLTTLSGNLELTGDGQWRTVGDGDMQLIGAASPKGDPAALEPLLRTLGRDLGGGKREIRFNAKVPIVRQLGF